ncbi:MAG: secretin N-terminal domain-containing protein [Candidatus Omnitrophica bacterium]|nr:secretin N-terminal domain-containing protein [Candidatus Omnitrophota bacterium]MDD5553255.1 secretin N-terminal domain-containing protein [Candidatus Omnitrophota bacterium]
MRNKAVFLFLCAVLFLAPLAESQEDPSSSGIQGRVSLDLRNIEVVEALKFLAMKGGLNIVTTKSVSGRVTLTVVDVPIQDVFDIMLRTNSLAYEKRGEIYSVMPEAEYRAFYGKNFSDTRQVKIFRLKYAVPDQTFAILDAIKSGIGRLLVEPESGTVLMMDTPEKLEEAQKTLESLEQESTVRMFTLKYAKAKDIEEQLKTQLDMKKVGSIKADERSNQVIVQALAERMDNIEELIKGLDKKTKEVLIETKIIKIRLSNQLDSGIEWEGLFNLGNRFGTTYLGSYPFSNITAGITNPVFSTREDVYKASGKIGNYPFSGTTSSLNASTKVIPGERIHIGLMDRKRDFDVLIKYLQTLGKTKIISSPVISAINNQEAKIHIGERRAFVTTTTTTGTTTTTVSEAVTFVDTGVQLSVTPMINDDGFVTMKIKPEISSIVGNVTSSSNNVIPIIDTSTAETTVMAKDGSTVLVGGLGGLEKTESTEGIPFLRSIPVLGHLFRSSLKTSIRNELLIMLTPVIFEGDRMVTAKDNENEKFGVKALKKFDVFKEEAAPAEITEALLKEEMPPAPLVEPVGPIENKDNLFMPKGLRPYN